MAVTTASPSPSRRTDAALQNLAGDFRPKCKSNPTSILEPRK